MAIQTMEELKHPILIANPHRKDPLCPFNTLLHSCSIAHGHMARHIPSITILTTLLGGERLISFSLGQPIDEHNFMTKILTHMDTCVDQVLANGPSLTHPLWFDSSDHMNDPIWSDPLCYWSTIYQD